MTRFSISIVAGAALFIAFSTVAQAGGIYAEEGGSLKDPVYTGVPVPAPMPIPETTAWYIRGDAGFASYQEPDVLEENIASLVNTGIDSTWTVGAGIGYYFTPNLRGDITVDYFSETIVKGRNISAATTFGIGRRAFDLNSRVVLANLYYDFDQRGHFSPYVGVGIGAAWNKAGPGTAYSAAGNGIIHDASTTDIAVALMAGASVKIEEGLHFDANYRYLYLGEAHTGIITDPAAVIPDGGDTAIDELHVHQFRVGLRQDIW